MGVAITSRSDKTLKQSRPEDKMMTKVLILFIGLAAMAAGAQQAKRGWPRIRLNPAEIAEEGYEAAKEVTREAECAALYTARQTCLAGLYPAEMALDAAKLAVEAACAQNKHSKECKVAQNAYNIAVAELSKMKSQCPAACKRKRSASFMEQNEAKQFI